MKKINVSMFAVLFALTAAACGPDPLKIRTAVSEAGSNDPTPSAGTPPIGTPPTPVADAPAPAASDTSSATATQTVTNTATATQITAVPLKILSVAVNKVDALGNPADDVRSFGVRFNEPAMDVELTVMSIGGSDFGHIVHHEYVAHSPESLYISPGNWTEKLRSDTDYQWVIRANADLTVMSGLGSTHSLTGTFKTAYCFIGETRHCYDGPAGTDGVGRCHGAMQECVETSAGFQWDAACPLGEVLPYQYGDIVGNGIDDDCNGIVDDGEAYFCPVDDSTISQGCCVPNGAVFNRPGLSNIMSLPTAHPEVRFLIKGSNAFVYYYSPDGKRYVFTNKDVITSWFTSFEGGQLGELQNVCNIVNEISDVELASITIGGNVTIRPGSYIITPSVGSEMSKFETWYFVVSRGKVLHRVLDTSILVKLYSETWKSRVVTLPDAFFPNYTIGPDLVSASDYDPAIEWAAADMEFEAGAKQ